LNAFQFEWTELYSEIVTGSRVFGWLVKTGLLATLRLLFAKIRVGECYGDFSTITVRGARLALLFLFAHKTEAIGNQQIRRPQRWQKAREHRSSQGYREPKPTARPIL
jgi:hypothetical protein